MELPAIRVVPVPMIIAATFSPSQEDFESDNVGDSCDNYPEVANPDQLDSDGERSEIRVNTLTAIPMMMNQ